MKTNRVNGSLSKRFRAAALLAFIGWVSLPTAITLADSPETKPAAGTGALQAEDRVAVIGDSITEQRMYSVFIEEYLLACQPASKLRIAQFGWSGESIWGLKARLANDVLWYKPTVATTCYGMNDGGYTQFVEATGAHYREVNEQVIDQMKEAGTRFIVVGGPGCVDSDTFKRPGASADVYNDTLQHLADISSDVAKEKGVVFANLHGTMMEVMAKLKAKHPGVPLCGKKDGIHPDENGHLVMAYAFLKALGCDGNIGTITVDLSGNQARATDGHKVISDTDGTIELESTRMPFIVPGDEGNPLTARGILDLFPFNDDLNRLQLVVTNCGSGKVKITWGTASKEFDAEGMAKGINLAAEFPDNPFSEPFKAIDKAVRAQQAFETPYTKGLLTNLAQYKLMLPDETEDLDRVAASGAKKEEALFTSAAAALAPVRHTIKIEVVK